MTRETVRVDITDETPNDVLEVRGIPLSPDANTFYDEESGECNMTFQKCDIKPEYINAGCAKCERAVERYIKQLIETGVAMPTERIVVTSPINNDVKEFWRNKDNTVFMHTDDDLKAVRDNWWFRFLKEIAPTIWHVSVEKWEYPYAFAVDAGLKHKKPVQAFVAYELPLVLVYSNRYYIVAPVLWRDLEEVKKDYLDAEAEQKKLIEELDKRKKELDKKVEDRKNGTGQKKEAEEAPKTRPVTSTKDKRERYATSTPRKERKYYTERPSEATHLPSRDQPRKEYHTTRGVRIR